MSDLERERDRFRAALEEIRAMRESWYDAMGDDEAGLPNEAAEECWDIAIRALEGTP